MYLIPDRTSHTCVDIQYRIFLLIMYAFSKRFLGMKTLIWMFFLGLTVLGKTEGLCNWSTNGGTQGIVSSPKFPDKYPTNQFCLAEINAEPDHKITIEFIDFDLKSCVSCSCDYVDIRGVFPNNSMKRAGRFCGDEIPETIHLETNRFRVFFKSDKAEPKGGYNFLWTATPNLPPTDPPNLTPTNPTPKDPPNPTSTNPPNLTPTNPTPTDSPNPTTTNPPNLTATNPTPDTGRCPVLPVHDDQKQSASIRNVQWLLNEIEGWKTSDEELPRAILALFLAEPSVFASPMSTKGAELKDILNYHVFSLTSRNATIRSQELALYVQALLVTCQDPRDFFGRDLVSELRKRVNGSVANPFEVLALCNAGARVTTKDVERVSEAFNNTRRPFWTDVQALATIAMQCLSAKRMTVDKKKEKEMQDVLKNRQFANGTVENLATTGLVVQALSGNGNTVAPFDLASALEAIRKAQGKDGSWGGSVRNSFYLLPALAGRSLLNISSAHCPSTKKYQRDDPPKLRPPRLNVTEAFVDVQVNTTLTLECSGEKPLAWGYIYPKYIMKNGSLEKVNAIPTNYDYDDKSFKSIIQITFREYLETGKYVCYYIDSSANTSLYVFVNDDSELLLPEDWFKILLLPEGVPSILPCFPTHSKTEVRLYRTAERTPVPMDTSIIEYSPMSGFLLKKPNKLFSGFIYCIAEFQNKTEEIEWHVTIYSEESLPSVQKNDNHTFEVQYSVWMGSDVRQGRFWKVRANNQFSLYDVIEKVSWVDNTHAVTYQVVEGKPHVRSLLGKEDDAELGLFWFVYARPANSTKNTTLLESSPVDIRVTPNLEFILWYKPSNWTGVVKNKTSDSYLHKYIFGKR